LLQNTSLLWSVKFPEQPETSYLFGTMHVRDQRAYAFIGQAYEKIEACERIALEFNLDEAPTGLEPSLVQLPDGLTLDQLIPEKKFRKMRAFLLRTCRVDLWQLRSFTPFFITNTITNQILAQDMPVALDEQLWRYARQQGKPGFGLETYNEQLRILNSIPLEDQVKSLVWISQHLRNYRQSIKRMADLYETGDIYRIYRAAKRSASGARALLLYRRNEIMAERIALEARSGSVFFGIGAGHLAGGKGVLRLLKREGARVRACLEV